MKILLNKNVDKNYLATMVSATTEDDIEKYYVAGYYDSDMRGLEDNLLTDDFDEAIDFAHRLASSGDYIRITNEITGDSVTFDADTWMDAIEFGEVPSEVYSII